MTLSAFVFLQKSLHVNLSAKTVKKHSIALSHCICNSTQPNN